MRHVPPVRSFIRRRRPLLALAVLGALLMAIPVGSAQTSGAAFALGSWQTFEFPQPQPGCTGVGYAKQLFSRADCGFGRVTLSPAAANKTVTFEFVDASGDVVATQTDATDSTGMAQFNIVPDTHWDPGTITVRASVAAPDTGSGDTQLVLNPLEATVSATQGAFAPGEPVEVTGLVNELDSFTCCLDRRTPVPASVTATLHDADGTQLGTPVTVTANADGEYAASFPGTVTAGLQGTAETDFNVNLGVRVQATYDDPTPYPSLSGPKPSGRWLGSGSGAAVVRTAPDSLIVRNLFVSSLGWVKPNESYPFRVLVENHTPNAAANASVTIPAPAGVVFQQARALGSGAGTATVTPSSVTWTIPAVEAATEAGPTTKTLVVQAKSKTLGEDPELVWKDLSSTATLTYAGYTGPALTSKSRGPKVIPPGGGFETARYGDKPFPVVPVDYRDRSHEERHSGDSLARVINAPDVEGSTFNLYQEMSHKQLFPFGDVPSTGIATAGFDYEPGFDFSTVELTRQDGTPSDCRGTTFGGDETKSLWGTALYPERIRDGWYQLPGDTEYYGGDYPAFAAQSSPPVSLDSACGPIGKGVFDAAVIADPEIDYNDFDSDKDGVVDFFMLVFVGLGGNGDSQINGVPPYDNIWPHSSSLEFYFEDPVTGLPGYTSDDRLISLEGVLQCYTDTSYSQTDDCGAGGQESLPAYVRVGPYNVNPESAIDHASVISHEYGHHLGLPDFYSSYSAYNDWNLMASDFSQHMTVFGKQELGWVVPRYLQPGDDVTVTDWEEVKNDTGEIEWETPDGTPYTLSAENGDAGIHNSEAYGVKLPGRIIIPAEQVPSGQYVWWSERGNDFGCAPEAGHNLDIALPELATLAPGTPVKVSFKSRWDIEWDFDYGFTLVTTDGANYTSLPSAKGFTTSKAQNPNASSCLTRHDNGLTGTTASYVAGTQAIDRAAGTYAESASFVDDEYDLTAYAGQSNVVLRLSYYTDPGLDRPGWMIDDLKLIAGSNVLYSSDFESEDEVRIFPGGCGGAGSRTADRCTDGWTRLQGGSESAQDHGYYLELRDRSGFDFDGRGQSDRGAIAWSPGVLVEYTDEVRGYGNNGGSQPPRQHYIDSQPQPGFDCGGNIYETDPPDVLTAERCQDAAFTAAAGDSMFSDVDWVDNFHDSSSEDGNWHFDYGCLTLNVLTMSGDTGNSAALPSDLTANATISAGAGCVPYDFGRSGVVDAVPTADATAKPNPAMVDEEVTFDASGSTDDGELTYSWSFGDGSASASGQSVKHAYAAAGSYVASLTVMDGAGQTDTDTVTVVVNGPPADLKVTNMTVGDTKGREGDKVVVTATVSNVGGSDAAASTTEFMLDGTTPLGTVSTASIPAGGFKTVTVNWDTRNQKGNHTITARADSGGAVAESDENNNTGTYTLSIKGNKVSNGNFEQSNAAGTAPESWSGSSTSSGSATYSSSGGTDGSKAAATNGNGGSAAGLTGSPSWTSAPIAVTPGELLDLVVSVKATGSSSPASAGLAYLGAAGQVLDAVKLIAAPVSTVGFQTLEKTVTVPAGVVQVRVVLTGFAPTDLATAGTVVFDDVGLFAH